MSEVCLVISGKRKRFGKIQSKNIQVKVWTPGEYSTKSYTRRLRPKVQTLTLLYNIFDKKGTSSVYLLLTNGTSFTYLV